MLRALIITALATVLAAALSCAASWDYVYHADALPGPPINSTDEVTHLSPDDLRQIVSIGPGNNALRIVDSTINRSRYRVDLDSLYGPGAEAGTMETRQRFVASSDMNNIAVMMRQDTVGASVEIRVGYYDAGDGREGLWNAKTGEFLGPVEDDRYHRLRMVLDGVWGGRLYVNDSYFANLSAAPGASSRLAFGAGSTLGAGEVYIDYFRWKHGVKAGPGEPGDPADPAGLISPRITSLPVAAAGVGSVTITWTTDVPSDSTVRWGTGWDSPNSKNLTALVTDHSVTIPGLDMGTTYRFYVESRVPGDQDIARSGIRTVTTADIFRIDSGPFARTGADGSSAQISWTTTLEGDSKLFYRLKGAGEWIASSSSLPTLSHALAVSGLSANSTYEYYVVSTRSGWPDAQSQVSEFFTYVYSGTGSLLVNGDFELGNLTGWTVPKTADPGAVHPGPWLGAVMPHSGNYFLGAESLGGARSGAIYQSVTNLPPGDHIYASVWLYTLERDSSGAEEHDSAYCQIGIDVAQTPGGSIDPNAASVRWSAPFYTSSTGPWTCVGVVSPRGSSTYATVFLRNIQTADGGLNVTCFDDAVLSMSAPVTITSGPTVTGVTATSATIEWETNVTTTGFVQFGPGAPGNYQFSDWRTESTPSTTHSATIRLWPATSYVFQVGAASPLGLALSEPADLSSPMNDSLENLGFEDVDSRERPTIAPWTLFQYDINQIPRFYDPGGQPAGGPVDGHAGPYPPGGPDWHGITCESDGGSYLIGAYSDGANKNGGLYQRVKVTPGQAYQASVRFLTRQDPIDGSHPRGNTACAIAIDPTGGTNVLAPALVWSADASSRTNGEWDEVSVRAVAASDIVTVFCVVEQRYANSVHLNALDNVSFEPSQSVAGPIGELKRRPLGTPVMIESTILTYAQIPPFVGESARLYVEEPDRSAGIGLISADPSLWSDPPYPGDRISAEGVLAVVSGEAVINEATITRTPGSPLDIPAALLVRHRSLGGGPFGIQPGVSGAFGLSNIGLLVKVAGKVASGDVESGWILDLKGDTCAYIDDGSALDSGSGWRGIKILADPIVRIYSPIKLNDTVEAVGVSSVEEVDGLNRPVVLVGDWTTIRVIQDGFGWD